MALDTSGSSSLFWKTGISTAGLEKGALKSKGILAGLSSSITKMDVFVGLGISAALVFAKISKQAYNFSKEFETAMKEVETISKAVQNDFKGISKEIIAMSKTVPDNAQKLTKALYQIVSAGYDGKKAMDILRRSTILATASVTDTFTAADTLTYVMNAYGEAAGTAAEISAKLFTIVRLGKVKMEELGPTISMVTGLAAEAGLAFNDLAAFYAEAVKKMQPHIVSTGIRGFVTALLRASKEGQESAKVAKEMGIEFDIATLKSKGLGYMLKQMSEATEGQKQKLMELFPNVRGLIGLLAVMTDGGEAFNKTLREIEDSLGADEKAFKTMVDTTENQLAILRNNIMAKLKPLGDSLLKQMNDIASGINIAMSGANDELSKLARSYSELTDTLQRKQGRIDDLIATIEDLKSKTELTEEETTNLNAAEEALIALLPNLGRAVKDTAGDFDILIAAKRGSLEVSLEIMELELALAEIEKKRADIAWKRFEASEDKASKEVKRLKKEVDTWYEEISERQTSYIRELFRSMEMYPLDNYTKQIDALNQIYDGAGISVRNFGERIRDIQKDMKMGESTIERQKKLVEEVTDALFARDKNLEKARLDLSSAELKLGEEEIQLRLNVKKTTEEYNIRTEAYEKFKKAMSEPPIVKPTPDKDDGDPDKVIPVITDEQIKAAEAKLTYMANQYKKYISDIAEFGEEYVEENNALLAEEGKNYGQFLSDMLANYKDNADLTRIITDDIYEYNKAILAKRKEEEEKYFEYIAEERVKDLKGEEDKFKVIIKNLKEGSKEYIEAAKQNKQNEIEINEKYDKEIAKAKLAVFKADLERQLGEEKEAYRIRLETAKTALGKKTKANEEYFKFIKGKLYKIAEIEKALAEENREALDSYLAAYKTTEEKIVAIKEKTAKLLTYTDNKYEKDKLKSIEKILIAEVKFEKAKQEIADNLAKYGEKLNNKELENYIKFLEKMKLKYSKYADIIILLNKEIADSQKQIWENVRTEISETVDAIHALADVVGNFDAELEGAINNLADLVSGIGQIMAGFAIGGISGITGALSGIAIIITSIINLFKVKKSYTSELKIELQAITLELQKQQNILNQSVGNAQTDAIQYTITLLENQIAKYKELIKVEQEAIAYHWWDIFHLFPYSATDQDKIDQYLAGIESAEAEIASLNAQYQEILTGTNVTSIGNSIADAIVNGFSQGLSAAEVFTDTFNDMMKKAIIDAFKRTIITKYIKDWYNQFATLSGGGLTTAEINTLASTYQNMVGGIEAQWEAIMAISEAANIELIDMAKERADITGLTGAIAGITEETAGLLAGQFQAIRINTVEVLSNMESIIIINSQIAENTEYNRFLTHLKSIDDKLSAGASLEKEYLRDIGTV